MNHFLQGKHSLSVKSLKPVAPSDNSIANRKKGGGNPKARHEQQIDVVKEGEKVTRIVVTCVCGEVIEIECLYPAGQ